MPRIDVRGRRACATKSVRVLQILIPMMLMSSVAEAQTEVTLHGTPAATLGGELRLSGTAYGVRGLADLRPLSQGSVVARLRQYDNQHRRWQVVREETVAADAGGRFAVTLPVPEQRYSRPQLQLEVRERGADEGRTFEYGVSLRSPLELAVLADRRRYEPGETAHLWMRLYEQLSGRPVSGRTLRVLVRDQASHPLVDRRVQVGQSGAVSLDVELPEGAPDGNYSVQVRIDDSVAEAAASTSFHVGRRTVERLLVNATLDQQVVPPSGRVTGHVSVTTPSGTPVVGAQVTLTAGREPTQVTTGRDGRAPIQMQAPAYLAGDVAPQTISVRVNHPAHGTLHTAASYLLSRVQWRVEARAENGALVPEVDALTFLSVTDPRGEPAPAGTQVQVRGPAVRGGDVTVEVDENGLAEVPMRVADGAAGPIRSSSGGCQGQIATRVTAEVLGDRPALARICVRVAREARVRPRLVSPLVRPGGEVEVELARHPEVRGRPVHVEVLLRNAAIAATYVTGERATIELPEGLAGVMTVRARPVLRFDARHPLDENGGLAVGVGATAGVLVRPADAFGLELGLDKDRYRVQEQASVALRTTDASPRAWAALVARDVAAHGGEVPWRQEWMHGRLEAAVASTSLEGAGERLLRSSLLDGLSPDAETRGPAPLVTHPWDRNRGQRGTPGVMRDPVAMRDELLRRGIGRAMVQLANATVRLNEEQRDGVLVERGGRLSFAPDAVETLRSRGQLADSTFRTLGHERMTVAMLQQADRSFSFDAAARRAARAQLVRLMVAITRFTNPDDENAARASAGQPPERWLSRMVQIGALQANALTDPWGRPFVLRRNPNARFLLSDRAPGWELVSPGPDGRPGTGDDVRNPFERVVPQGTPYAVASGEDRLMKQLSVLSTGNRVLAAMARAYDTLSLSAREEQRGGAVTATASEGGEALDALGSIMGGAVGEAQGFGGLGLRGTGRGGGGMGAPMAPAAEPMEAEMAEERATARRSRARAEADDSPADNAQTRGPRQQGQSTFAQLSAIVREEFPATLHFLGEVALDGTTTTVPLPLADALTTYRIEAIAWTGSGWVTTAQTELRVDQDATVDAPTPPFATAGDVLRLPVRVQNRTGEPLRAKVLIDAEEIDVSVTLEQEVVEVPPHDAVEVVARVTPSVAGVGALVVRCLRASDDAPYDAVRRPLTVWPDARTVREQRDALVEEGAEILVEVPADATPRGPGELRIAPGTALFGDLASYGGARPNVGWALAILGEEVPEAVLAVARRVLRTQDPVEEHELHGNPVVIGQALGAVWSDATVPDAVARRALRAMSNVLGTDVAEPNAAMVNSWALVLESLAPAVRGGGRGELRPSLDELVQQLRRRVGSGAVQVADAPSTWAHAAHALALTGGAERARELLRRAERFVVRFGDEAFLEPNASAGQPRARIQSSAWMASARAALGERSAAMPFLRSMAALATAGRAAQWDLESRVAATLAAGLVTGGSGAGVQVTLDGQAVELRAPDDGAGSGIRVATLEGLGTPGTHRIRISGTPLALALLQVRYGRPWDAPPRRAARLALSIEGEVGPRDARAGLALTIRNQDPRIMTRPIVEIDLPAGTELDEPTREGLRALTIAEPTVEGRTLRLQMRPLAPGGYARLPLPLRWSVGGTLRGLGVSAYDEIAPQGEDLRPMAVLRSRAVAIEDEGEEPEPAEPEASPVPRPPEPEPRPLPLLERIGPVSMRIEPGSAPEPRRSPLTFREVPS